MGFVRSIGLGVMSDVAEESSDIVEMVDSHDVSKTNITGNDSVVYVIKKVHISGSGIRWKQSKQNNQRTWGSSRAILATKREVLSLQCL